MDGIMSPIRAGDYAVGIGSLYANFRMLRVEVPAAEVRVRCGSLGRAGGARVFTAAPPPPTTRRRRISITPPQKKMK